MTEYKPKFIEGITIKQIDDELRIMYDNQYRYGWAIDRVRVWDLEHTKKVLKGEV